MSPFLSPVNFGRQRQSVGRHLMQLRAVPLSLLLTGPESVHGGDKLVASEVAELVHGQVESVNSLIKLPVMFLNGGPILQPDIPPQTLLVLSELSQLSPGLGVGGVALAVLLLPGLTLLLYISVKIFQLKYFRL